MALLAATTFPLLFVVFLMGEDVFDIDCLLGIFDFSYQSVVETEHKLCAVTKNHLRYASRNFTNIGSLDLRLGR